MIASDIHGSSYYCQKLKDAYKYEKPDRLILLGDILYHGPRNDLPKEYAPKKVIEMLNSISDSILCVRGNCDCEVDQMVLNFPCLADYSVLDINGLFIYCTHGHLDESFDRICRRSVFPDRTHFFSFCARTVVNNITAHIDKHFICVTHISSPFINSFSALPAHLLPPVLTDLQYYSISYPNSF